MESGKVSESFRNKIVELLEQNPHMTYAELAKNATYSEYDIRRALGLIL
jgi:DeoR/GlpR family transcriptional regulator of sugar metabolism